MTSTQTSPSPELPELDKLASKILGIGGFAAFAAAQVGVAKSASALLLGYATYGAAIPLVGYAGLTVGAYALANYHFKRLGWDQAPVDTATAGATKEDIPSASELQTAYDGAQSDLATLNSRIEELGNKLGRDNAKSQPKS